MSPARRPWLPLLWVASAASVGEESPGSCSTGGGPCGSTGDVPAYHWPMQKGSIGRTGFSKHPVPDLTKGSSWNWFDPFHDVARASPLIDDEKSVYVMTVAGRIYKFNDVGVIVWERRLDAGIPTGGALYNGSLFLGTRDGRVLSLDMKSGEDRWDVSVSVIGLTAADPATIFAHDGTVVAATHSDADDKRGNSDVVAIRAEDGGFLWRFQPEQTTVHLQVCSPGDGTIIFQDKAGGVYRLGLADGRLIWKSSKQGVKAGEGQTTGATVCHEGKVFAVNNPPDQNDGLLRVYSVEDGRQLWQIYLPYLAHQAVAIGPHPTEKGRLMAVLGIGESPGMPPILPVTGQLGYYAGLLFHQLDLSFPWLFGNHLAALAAYDLENGKRFWLFEMDPFQRAAAAGESERIRKRYADIMLGANPNNDFVCLPGAWSQPVIGPDGTVYIGSQDGRLYAVRDADGNGQIHREREVSSYDFGEGFQAPPALAPGMLVAMPCGGGLRVFQTAGR